MDLERARILMAAAGLVLMAVSALAQGAAQAQPRAEGFGERIDVALVTVDVWVSDRQGNPVTGLGADSFEVLHDGKPVSITHFVEVRGGVAVPPPAAAAGADPAGPATAASPSHLVVYFDQSRLHPGNLPPLVRGLEELLDAGSVEAERVLILSQDRSLRVAAPFGSSRKQLGDALAGLAKGGAGGVDAENEVRLALDAIRTAWEQVDDVAGAAASGIASIPTVANPAGEPGVTAGGSPRAVVGGVGSGGGPDACGMFVNQIQPILESWTRSRSQRIAVTLGNLSDAASFLAGLPGVKTLLYLSDGLDTQPGAALVAYASGLCPSAGADLAAGTLSEQMADGFLELTRHANTNRVTVYSLQAGGLRSPRAASAAADRGTRGGGSQRSSGAFEARKRAGEREGLSLIADRTGGRAVFNKNEFGPELLKIGEESRSYYSLAYEPPADPESAGRRSHDIEVEVGDGSLITRYRRGYQEKNAEQWLTERIEGALNLGITSNPLAVRLGAGAVRAVEDGAVRLPLHVMIPVERLTFLPAGGEWVAEIVLRILTRSVDTNALTMYDRTFRVKGSPEATGLADLPVELELGAGDHLAAIGVQDRSSREASFVATMLAGAPGG